MKKINNYWTDERNNKWNCNLYTEEQAEKLSKTMDDCSDCSDCSRCSDYKSNPDRYCKRLSGTVNKLAQVYWLNGNIQVVFGCWKGTSIDEFRKKAKEKVSKDQLPAFMKFADTSEYLITT